jgi:hypothetical protein
MNIAYPRYFHPIVRSKIRFSDLRMAQPFLKDTQKTRDSLAVALLRNQYAQISDQSHGFDGLDGLAGLARFARLLEGKMNRVSIKATT